MNKTERIERLERDLHQLKAMYKRHEIESKEYKLRRRKIMRQVNKLFRS